MAERTDLRPVQVFLDTQRFIEIPPTEPRPRGAKDFFKDNDKAFAEHKKRMTSAMTNAAEALRSTKQPAGFVRVRQRSDALAKSHRPMNALFSESHGFSLVGAETAGELLFQATSNGLDRLARIVEERAEATPKQVLEKVVDGVATPLVALNGPGYTRRQWHTIAMSVAGPSIRVTLDGTLVAEANDTALVGGQAGLYTRALGGIRFDDVTVTAPS